jgi:energy-coupling factor transport system ATP-binding protein
MSIIKLNNLSFYYNENNPIINNLNLEIKEGEFLCILGHNGSGKSTLAKLIVGLLKAKQGEIIINNTVLDINTVDKVRHSIGIVFQNPDNQFVGITVKDDIAFGLENRNINRNEMIERINKYAKIVNMNEFLDANPVNLSGGQKQRVSIASVLACDPKIIVFDESTSMLDPKGVKEVIEEIKKLKGNKTIIYITHNLNEVFLSDRVVVMNKGSITFDGTPNNLFKERKILEEASLDVINEIKLIDLLEKDNLLNKKEIIDTLWELVYQM